MRARVEVSLKAGILDPQGKAVGMALGRLGFNEITSVRIGRTLHLQLDEEDPERARARVDTMCQKLLANTVIEDYRIELEHEPASQDPAEG